MHAAPSLVSDALDRLYAAPLDAFVALRKELAGALRAAGDAAGAREVAAARKPSRPSWALNQVARRHPEAIRSAFDAHAAASRAQAQGAADEVRETVRAFRDALAEVVRRCAGIAAEGGVSLNAAQERQLGETVRAALASGTQDTLLSGRLRGEAEAEEEAVFAEVEASAAPRAPKPGAKAANAAEADDRRASEARERAAQRARQALMQDIDAAQARVSALDEEARQARIAAREGEIAARRAEAEAERARRVADDFEERLEKARAALAELHGLREKKG